MPRKKARARAQARQPQPPPITPRLLTIKQAAAYLSATIWSVRQLLWSHTLPHIAIGRRFLIDQADLDGYIDAQRSASVRDAKAIANRLAALSAR
jgi:excisionase family DNA binding protein